MTDRARVMHVHFWGDVRLQAGSVDKVIAAFAQMDEHDLDIMVACLGEGVEQRIGTARYCFFSEDRLTNRIANKFLGLNLFTFSRLATLIERERPDLLHVHNRHGLLGPLLGRLSYRPHVLCHYHRRFGNFVVPDAADGLVAVSHAVREALIMATTTAKPVEVVYNPVPVGLGDAPARTAAVRPRLLYGGGRQQKKGFDELEKALAGGLANAFDIVLCGPEFDGYQPPFPARVAGMLPSDAFLGELRQADVVVMPSHHEGFSILLLEALAMGRLVVATRCGGLGEILDDRNALTVPVGDAVALASGLQRAAALFRPEHAEGLSEIQQQAKASAAHFSVSAINRRLAEVYRHFLSLPFEAKA